MPRKLKRRSEAISRNEEESEAENEPSQPPPRRRRSTSESEAESESNSDDLNELDATQSQSQATSQTLIKKLVRLALSAEYARIPLRRNDINAKILKDAGAVRSFKAIFAGAQQILQDVFGMQLIELPSREKTGLKDRRKAAAAATQQGNKSQSQSQAGVSTKGAQSWILTSILPSAYKTNPLISQPPLAQSGEAEAVYTSLYTFILSVIYLSEGVITEAKLERHLKRVNMDQWTPVGSLEKLLQRMTKDGYVDKRRDTTGGDDIVEWVVGPRGKVEVGVKGVAGLVRSVYGFGAVPLEGEGNMEDEDDNEGGGAGREETNGNRPRRVVKIEHDELEKKLKRSLGVEVPTMNGKPTEVLDMPDQAAPRENDGDVPEETSTRNESLPARRVGRRRRRGAEEVEDGNEQ